MIKEPAKILNNKKKIALLIIAVSIFIISIGFTIYKYEENLILQQKHTELRTVANLKQKQLEQWYNEIIDDVQISTKPAFLANPISLWLNDIGNSNLKNDILHRFEFIKEELHYQDIIIFSTDGKLLLSTKQKYGELDSIVKQKLMESYKNRKITLTDLYLCSIENEIHFDIIAPIFDEYENIIALILFRRDPNLFLFPIIQDFPNSSPTSVVAILRREGDYVLYLNNLRHKENTALRTRLPITRIETPSVQAALGVKGIIEGIDYRGVPVVADIRIIPQTNWIMVVKVDKNEIYKEITIAASVITGFTLLIIFICVVGILLFYNSRQKDIYKELYKKEKEIWQSQEKFKVTMDCLGSGILITDIKAKIQYMNKLAEELTGWNYREAKGRHLSEIYKVRNEETGLIENNILDRVIKHGIVKELASHTILISKSGKEMPVMDTGAPIYDSDGTLLGIVVASTDETEKRKQQRLVKESEERLRTTLDDMIEGCQILDHNWKYLYINNSAEKQNRRPKSELLGKIYMDMWPGIESTNVFSLLKKCMQQRVSSKMINEFEFPDGSKGWFTLSFEPVKEGILILSEDITQQKQAEETIKATEVYLSSLFNSITDVILTVSFPNRIIRHTNLAVFNLLGYAPEEIIGKNTCMLYANEETYLDSGEELSTAIIEHTPFVKKELELLKKDGTKIYCDVRTTFLKTDGIIDAVISVVRDITQTKKTEIELIEAKEKAEQSDSLKSEFLSQISHEIRTPLNVILSFVDLLKDELQDKIDDELFIGFKDVDDEGKRLMRTIELIINMSELQTGSYKSDPMEINVYNDILVKIHQAYQLRAEQKELSFDLVNRAGNPVIVADKYSLSQIFSHLVDNALKYTPKGRIEVSVNRGTNNNLYVEVADTGIGISEEYMQLIFTPFTSEEKGYTRNYEGNGLGLALAKKYCELNKAEILATSCKGKGSVFRVTFLDSVK